MALTVNEPRDASIKVVSYDTTAPQLMVILGGRPKLIGPEVKTLMRT